jgi:F-type H+-transporting ATPase subunit delta
VEDNRVGRRYAQALFGAAQGLGVVESVESDLGAIVGMFESDETFRHFLMAPYTSRDEKVKISEKLFSDRITALTMQVLRVMLEKRREGELPAVYREFVALRREAQGVVHVVVTSAEELDSDQRRRLIDKLQLQLSATVEADFKVDPRMIGGVRVAYKNSIFDGSVRGALRRLRERLKYDLLKQA